jgi:pantothenate kinase
MPQWKNNLGEWILVCSATNGKTFRVMKTCRFSAAPGFLKYLFKKRKKETKRAIILSSTGGGPFSIFIAFQVERDELKLFFGRVILRFLRTFLLRHNICCCCCFFFLF